MLLELWGGLGGQNLYTNTARRGPQRPPWRLFGVYVFSFVFPWKQAFWYTPKLLFCLFRDLSFQSWKHLWCILFSLRRLWGGRKRTLSGTGCRNNFLQFPTISFENQRRTATPKRWKWDQRTKTSAKTSSKFWFGPVSVCLWDLFNTIPDLGSSISAGAGRISTWMTLQRKYPLTRDHYKHIAPWGKGGLFERTTRQIRNCCKASLLDSFLEVIFWYQKLPRHVLVDCC